MPVEYIIAIILIPLALLAMFSIIFVNKKLKFKSINIDWLLSLLGEDNITKVEKTNKRISITFKDLKLVDLESLKEKTKGIFVKGNSIVVTFLSDQDEIYESLKKITK